MASQPQQPLEDLLAAITDAMLAGEDDFEPIINDYDVPRSSVESFVPLINRLNQTLISEQPSSRFVHQLKQDLMGVPQGGLVARVRYLPARVQLAAGVVAAAGFMLLVRRRLLDITSATTAGDESEVPAIQ
ncbi:MAG TPA: hypothetical protein VHL11_02015 [Phototrophicaceae bacterium]|jgi:hypothetical protein|nr:hypothetical protein [Phototrophicaceae bacterium]